MLTSQPKRSKGDASGMLISLSPCCLLFLFSRDSFYVPSISKEKFNSRSCYIIGEWIEGWMNDSMNESRRENLFKPSFSNGLSSEKEITSLPQEESERGRERETSLYLLSPIDDE